jgi:uncharacterized protein (DUF433 family)
MNLPDFLEQDCYGYIRLAGHRIGLHHLIELHNRGYRSEGLQTEFPTLPADLIRNVIAYYAANQAEVDAYVRRTMNSIDALAAAPQTGPDAAELRRRMEARRRKETA